MIYYNEIEPFCVGWLHNLAVAGRIPTGRIDSRSIRDVRPHDLDGVVQAHFFAGIAGWARALELARWPYDMPIWTGSCPCQPFSIAGARKGFADDRHLWPAWFDLIRECLPPVVVGEQVAGRAGLEWLDAVFADLEGIGYACGAADLPAACVGAPHRRQRLFFVATLAFADPARCGVGGEARLHAVGAPGHDIARCSPAGELADAQAGGQRVHGSAPWETGHADQRDSVGVLADAGCVGLEGGQHASAGEGTSGVRRRSADGRCTREPGVLGNAVGDGVREHARELPGDEAQHALGAEDGDHQSVAAGPDGFWDDLIWLPCSDGKARPTQPGLPPMVDGLPEDLGDRRAHARRRTGQIRGYGNAIVPQVAAKFLEAIKPLVGLAA